MTGRKKRVTVDPMDGAHYTLVSDKDKTPADYMDGADGLRPGESEKPRGVLRIDLSYSAIGKNLPPRSVWKEGHWKNNNKDKYDDDWEVWVVSGEGTPGNYLEREYQLPLKLAADQVPKHPADWSKADREPTKWKSDWGSGSGSTASKPSASSGLPFGLRIRCPKCGHFFKMNDLADHAKSACAAVQAQPAMWVIECECHPGDLQMAATVLPGFPVEVVSHPDGFDLKAPDTSGDKPKDDKPAEKPKKTGVVVEATDKAGTPA